MTKSLRWFGVLILCGWALLVIPTHPADLAWPLAIGYLAAVAETAWHRARVTVLIRTAHRRQRRVTRETV